MTKAFGEEYKEKILDTPGAYPAKLMIVSGLVLLTQLLITLLNAESFVNYDCAYYLLGAKLLLSGKQPILNFVDILPPLTLYLPIPIVWLSQCLLKPIALVWSITVWTLVALSYCASFSIVRSASAVANRRDWLIIGPLMCSFLLFNLVLGFHFGQREHIFILSFFPLFLIRWLRWSQPEDSKLNGCLAATCGFVCAILTFIKPQFLLLPLMMEIYFHLRFKGLKLNAPKVDKVLSLPFNTPESVSFVSSFVACLLISCFIPNIVIYYTRWLPVITLGYGAFFTSSLESMLYFVAPDGQLLGSRLLVPVFLICAFLLNRTSVLAGALLVWTFAGFLLYLIQGRGWSYQSIPAICGYFLLANVVVVLSAEWVIAKLSSIEFTKLERVLASDPTRYATILFLVHGLVLLPLSTLLIHNSSATATTLKSLDSVIAKQSSEGDTVVILHTLVPNAHQAQLHSNRLPGCRFVWCFPMRMIAYIKQLNRSLVPSNLTDTESEIVTDIVEDIQNSRPKLIAIEAFDSYSSGWSLYKSLISHDFTNRALRNYEPIGCTHQFAIWKLRTAETQRQTGN